MRKRRRQAASAGLQSGDTDGWRSFLGRETGRDLSRKLMSWQAELPLDRAFDKAVVDIFRSGVEAALAPDASNIL